jgi:hypothetical protein
VSVARESTTFKAAIDSSFGDGLIDWQFIEYAGELMKGGERVKRKSCLGVYKQAPAS